MFRFITQLSLIIGLVMMGLCVLVHALARQLPTSGQVIYSASLLSKRQLYISDIDRNLSRRFHISASQDEQSTVAPITRDIVFVSDRDGDTELFWLSANGHDLRQLTHNDYNDAHPQWLSDGRYILYQANPDNISQFFVLDIASGDTRAITDNTIAFGRPMGSPDGSKIAYDSVGEIYILDLSTDTTTRLTDDGFWDQHPVWSPDGRTIIYESNRGREWVLYQIDLNTLTTTVLTNPETTYQHVTWTHDPNRIVFQATHQFPGRLYRLQLDAPLQVEELMIPPPSGSSLYLLWGLQDVLQPNWTDILEPAWVVVER